jgi:hypothetical protein
LMYLLKKFYKVYDQHALDAFKRMLSKHFMLLRPFLACS